jgi:hypothetical protein
MPGSPLTGQGGQFGGPRYGWGEVPNQPGAGLRSGGAGSRTNFNSGLNRGRYTSSPEAGLHRGEWQWRGHGPSAQRSYGWDYQGGVGRDEITQRSEARMGSSFQARMAQERSGGLPQGNYAIDYDRGERTGRGGGQGVDYDWGWQGHGGPSGGGMPRYGSEYGGGGYNASGGHTFGGGSRGSYGGGYGASGGVGFGSGGRGYGASGGMGYGEDYRGGGYNASGGVFGGSGNRQSYRRDFQGGYGGGMRGGYGGDYSQPLGDAEFYRRVERW